jgi:hypothetical protein
MATSLSILISDTSGCVIFRKLSIAPVSGQPWEDFQFNHLVLAFLVAARFADPIVSLQPYQFARDRFAGGKMRHGFRQGTSPFSSSTRIWLVMIS